jgi:hypothetical protein
LRSVRSHGSWRKGPRSLKICRIINEICRVVCRHLPNPARPGAHGKQYSIPLVHNHGKATPIPGDTHGWTGPARPNRTGRVHPVHRASSSTNRPARVARARQPTGTRLCPLALPFITVSRVFFAACERDGVGGRRPTDRPLRMGCGAVDLVTFRRQRDIDGSGQSE